MKSFSGWITLALIFYSGVNLRSQNFSFGIGSGMGITQIRTTDRPDDFPDLRFYYPLLSYNVNTFLGYKSSHGWGLSIEPGYILKGGVLHHQSSAGAQIKIKFDYIRTPLLFDLFLSDKWTISFGPEFAYMTGAKSVPGSEPNSPIDLYNDIYDHHFEISGVIGVCFKMNDKVDVGLRFGEGLTRTSNKFFTNSNGDNLGDLKEYNQYLHGVVKYALKRGRHNSEIPSGIQQG